MKRSRTPLHKSAVLSAGACRALSCCCWCFALSSSLLALSRCLRTLEFSACSKGTQISAPELHGECTNNRCWLAHSRSLQQKGRSYCSCSFACSASFCALSRCLCSLQVSIQHRRINLHSQLPHNVSKATCRECAYICSTLILHAGCLMILAES